MNLQIIDTLPLRPNIGSGNYRKLPKATKGYRRIPKAAEGSTEGSDFFQGGKDEWSQGCPLGWGSAPQTTFTMQPHFFVTVSQHGRLGTVSSRVEGAG